MCSDSASEEWYCLVCNEAYSDSNKGDWVERIVCKIWTHVEYVIENTTSFFVSTVTQMKTEFNHKETYPKVDYCIRYFVRCKV